MYKFLQALPSPGPRATYSLHVLIPDTRQGINQKDNRARKRMWPDRHHTSTPSLVRIIPTDTRSAAAMGKEVYVDLNTVTE